MDKIPCEGLNEDPITKVGDRDSAHASAMVEGEDCMLARPYMEIQSEGWDQVLITTLSRQDSVLESTVVEEEDYCMLAPAQMKRQSQGSDQVGINTASSQDLGHASGKDKSQEDCTLAIVEMVSPREVLKQKGPAKQSIQDMGPSPILPQQQNEAAVPHAVQGSQSPFPYLAWINSSELWHEMRSKDICKADPEVDFIVRHPSIPLTGRLILLDWMMEVCERYKLQRETYYLAVDIYDRFLDAQDDFPVEKLQLLGATCLFLANKIEEITSWKVASFVYVTNNFFLAGDIVNLEFVICRVLDWKIGHHSVTVNTWTKFYLQVASNCLSPPGPGDKAFVYPTYSTDDYVRVMQLLDFCSVDIASRKFGNSVLAASAVYVALEKHRTSLGRITGFELAHIHHCVDWLQPFSEVIYKLENRESSPSPRRSSWEEDSDSCHNIQVHDFDMEEEYEDVLRLRLEQLQAARAASGSCTCVLRLPLN